MIEKIGNKEIDIEKTLQQLSGYIDLIYESGFLDEYEKKEINNIEDNLHIWVNHHKRKGE